MSLTCCKLIPSRVERKVFWMFKVLAFAMLAVKPNVFKLGKPSKSMVPTEMSWGKVSEFKIWQLLTVNLPPMEDKLSAPTIVMPLLPEIFKSPVMALTEAKLRVSVVPVATAMLPE